MNQVSIFAVIYRRGPKWNDAAAFHQQLNIDSHRDFLAAQLDAGALLFGGPFLDNTGGLAVYVSESRESLEEILATDPTVVQKLLSYEVHPYLMAFKKA